MALTFTLPTARGVMNCFACTKYYPYWVDGERNPRFDKSCGYILTLKDAKERNFGAAVGHYSEAVSKLLAGFQFSPPSHVLLVPSSKANKVSEGLTRVMTKVCSGDKRFVLRPSGLTRTKDIQKLAAGGDRSLEVHEASLSYQPPKEAPNLILLVDDVATSGNSLIACCNLVQQHHPFTPIVSVVLGRTAHD